jgi:hypothetical protein
MASISTTFQKVEFPSDSMENPLCSNCWEQGSKNQPLFDIHPNGLQDHLLCRACIKSWITSEDLKIKKVFECYLCNTIVNVDQSSTRVLGILPDYEEAASDGYVLVATDVEEMAKQALASPPLLQRYMPAACLEALLDHFEKVREGGEAADEPDWVELERDLSDRPGGAASSASVAADPEWRPERVSFAPDCQDKGTSKEWRIRTEIAIDAETKETFETLSNPSPGHQEIATLLKTQLTVDLYIKHRETRYKDAEHQFASDLECFADIEEVFFDAINNTIEEVVRTERTQTALVYLTEQILKILYKSFTQDEESTSPVNARYNAEVLTLCRLAIWDMLQKPCVCRVLESFFLENLNEELAKKGKNIFTDFF